MKIHVIQAHEAGYPNGLFGYKKRRVNIYDYEGKLIKSLIDHLIHLGPIILDLAQGIWALSSNPDESFRQYRKLYMTELKKANDNMRARQAAQEKYHAQMHALQERIELESHFPHCRYCGRRLPEKPRRHEDLICIFCLAELNNLPKTGEPEKTSIGLDKYQSPPSPGKTHFLTDAKNEHVECLLYHGCSPYPDWFVAYSTNR
ncbi:MAG: hypothetical protein MUP81_02600 [Dehalococcoidia bacterium]|nr:hypothetical protein [Dehalococcoidia bacterium]